jgi:hypothetical protein
MEEIFVSVTYVNLKSVCSAHKSWSTQASLYIIETDSNSDIYKFKLSF